uniref:(northern house mosquito) hypothetical protein n=1 Tax=Culex pipiens TaxID=7175 RepID=A0A8D8C240_CULPI
MGRYLGTFHGNDASTELLQLHPRMGYQDDWTSLGNPTSLSDDLCVLLLYDGRLPTTEQYDVQDKRKKDGRCLVLCPEWNLRPWTSLQWMSLNGRHFVPYVGHDGARCRFHGTAGQHRGHESKVRRDSARNQRDDRSYSGFRVADHRGNSHAGKSNGQTVGVRVPHNGRDAHRRRNSVHAVCGLDATALEFGHRRSAGRPGTGRLEAQRRGRDAGKGTGSGWGRTGYGGDC